MSGPTGEHPYEPYRPRHGQPPGSPPPGYGPPPAYPRRPSQPPPPGRPQQPGYPQAPYQQQPTYLPPAPPPGALPGPRLARPSGLSGRSRRFWYAIALIALLPGWLGFSVWRASSQSYGMDRYAADTEVDRGSAAEVSGARWRLSSIAPAPPPTRSLTGKPPRGSTLVRAYIEVTPHTPAAAKNIAGCSFAARDDRGRVWDEADSHYVESDDTVPDSCRPPGIGADYIPAGHTQKVGVTFLVPADAARSLRPMVRPTYRTHYVLFR